MALRAHKTHRVVTGLVGTERRATHPAPIPKVIGEGHSLETHTPFYLVTSRSVPGHLYVVYRFAARLQCTCQAGRFDKVCVHRAVVRDFLLDRMERRSRHRLILGTLRHCEGAIVRLV